MTTPAWKPGELYPPGSLVVPRTPLPTASTAITNPSFESGSTDWTLPGGASISSSQKFNGAQSVQFTGTAGIVTLKHSMVAVSAGKSISASAMYQQGGASATHNGGKVFLKFYTAALALIGAPAYGNLVDSASNGAWKPSTVTAQAPVNAAFVEIGFEVNRDRSNNSYVDYFTWNYYTQAAPAGLIYKATQAASGYSASTEPNWPTTVGASVVDNEVTWQGVLASRVVWKAIPILKSGATEPTWPTQPSGQVADNTIKWKLIDRRITDVKCPNSKITIIDQGKVYMADKDIVAFSATNNPLDWTRANDAGYLPFGLGKYGANPIAAMGLYRGNLTIFNSQGFQLWQIDPDPALNNRIDALPIGSIYHKAFAPVSNDAFFLSSLGIRTIGIAASSTNIKAGDVGLPIDPLIQAKLRLGEVPFGTYAASAGQYWLIFKYVSSTEVFVYTLSQVGSVGAWTRYIFPYKLDYYSIDADILLLRTGDKVLEVREEYAKDQIIAATPGSGTEIVASFQWGYLEMGGQLGQDKCVEGFDIVGLADPASPPQVAFGWNQNDLAAFTPFVTVPADSVPDYMIPIELTAPAISVKVQYNGGKWQFSAMNVYLQGRRLAR